jgi:hypothetical protein
MLIFWATDALLVTPATINATIVISSCEALECANKSNNGFIYSFWIFCTIFTVGLGWLMILFYVVFGSVLGIYYYRRYADRRDMIDERHANRVSLPYV